MVIVCVCVCVCVCLYVCVRAGRIEHVTAARVVSQLLGRLSSGLEVVETLSSALQVVGRLSSGREVVGRLWKDREAVSVSEDSRSRTPSLRTVGLSRQRTYAVHGDRGSNPGAGTREGGV